MDESLHQLAPRIRKIVTRKSFITAATLIGYAYVIVAVVIGAVLPYSSFFTTHDIKARSIDEVLADHDYVNPLRQLAAHPHFSQTFIWWIHNWIGEYRNWRPLATQFFWVEYKLFGPYRFDEYSAVAIAMHLLVLVTLAWFVKSLTNNRMAAALSILLFAGSPHVFPLKLYHAALESQFMPPAVVCLGKWKDTVDFWYCACLFASSALALKGRWGPSMILAFMSPCFKETGWMVYPVNLLLIGFQGRTREIPKWVRVGTVASIALLLVFRVIAGTNVMGAYTQGHNISWASRYSGAVDGVFLATLVKRPAVAILAAAIALICVRRNMGLLHRFIAICIAFVCSLTIDTITITHDASESLAALFDPVTEGGNLLACLLWAYGLCALATDVELRRYVPLLLLFRLVAAATLVITLAVGAHVLYLSEAYAAVIAALAVVAVGRRLTAPLLGWLNEGPAVVGTAAMQPGVETPG